MDLPDFPKPDFLKNATMPHRAVDGIIDTILGIPKSLGSSVMSGLDKLPLGSSGPHRGVEGVLNAAVNGVEGVGNGISSALDKPAEVIAKELP